VSALPEPSGAPAEPLREGLRQLDVPAPQTVERLLDKYLDEIERWNPRFGFVKAANRQELIVKHVLDSLAAWPQVKAELKGGAVLDVGSGAGFPGIPLAIALPDVPVTLLERSAKKVSFLRTCKALLGLARVEVVHGDLADASRLPFDVVTFRAVAPVARFLDDSRQNSLRFQAIIAYKGRVERANAEIDDVRRSRGDIFRAEVVPVKVPFLGEERCLVVLRTSCGDDRY
jgi:16S rRNA (guanine527-N7)-methyltransferase